MKKTLIRALVMILALVMLVPLVLAGCNSGGSETSTKPAETETSETGSSTISVMFPFIENEVKEADYSNVNNGIFTILYQGPNDPLYSHEIYIKDGEKSSDKIDYAIYKRNAKTQEFFKIKFDFQAASGSAHSKQVIDKVRSAAGSGDNAYQLVIASHGGDYTPVAMEEGTFLNLKSLPNLDLSKGYWAKYVNDNAEVSGAIFGVTGSISLNLYQELYVCFFNSSLCRTNGIEPESLYELVLNKQWTLDKMIELTQDIYTDTNGNGYDTEDIYGYGMVFATLDTVWSSCDISMAATDASGRLKLNVDKSRLGNVLRKLNSFTWSQKGVMCIDNEADADAIGANNKTIFAAGGAQMVATGHTLFANDRLYNVTIDEMKNCKDYGILPYPKYNRSQKQYYTGARDHYTVHMVPLPAKNMADVCGSVLEYLACTSHNEVMPTYYEEVLSGRYTRDTDSIEMLNIIFQNVKMDAGYVYGLMTLQLMRNLVMINNSGIDSVYQEKSSGAAALCNRISNNYARYVSNDR